MFDDEDQSRVKDGKKQVLSLKPLETRFIKYHSTQTERYRFQTRGAIFSLFLFGHCPSMKPQLNHSGSLSNKDNILLWSLKKRLASQVRPQLLVLSLYKPVMKPDISFHMFKSLCKQSTKKYKAQICFMCLLWVGGYFLYCKIIA